MEQLLKDIARGLVEEKDAVQVTVDEPNEEGVIVYHLKVADTDTGRVIGKQGHDAFHIVGIVPGEIQAGNFLGLHGPTSTAMIAGHDAVCQ